jgi:hypothetical protein
VRKRRFFFLCEYRLLLTLVYSLTFRRVHSGSLEKHPRVDFAKWAPVRTKAILQAFTDFLVASRKDRQGMYSFSSHGSVCSS